MASSSSSTTAVEVVTTSLSPMESEDIEQTGAAGPVAGTSTAQAAASDSSAEERRRKSYKRLLPIDTSSSGKKVSMSMPPSPASKSKSFVNSASSECWELQKILKNVPSGKPLLNPPHIVDANTQNQQRSGLHSCVDFSSDGELIAAGDIGGQIVVYHRNSQFYKPSVLKNDQYHLLTVFDAHDQIFDVMTSCMGESNITQVKWLKNRKCRSEFLLSAGYKTVKLWKVEDKPKLTYNDIYGQSSFINSEESGEGDGESIIKASPMCLPLPKVVNKKWQVSSSLRALYGMGNYSYEFNSVSPNSDQETFLSADYTRVTLWDLERNLKTDLVDLLNVNGETRMIQSLDAILVTAEFHPTSCNLYAYGQSNGVVRLCDLRQRSMHQRGQKTMDGSSISNRILAYGPIGGEYKDLINTIRHLKFSPSGRYVMTRKYMSLEIWDINMESRPVETYDVQEWVTPRLELICDVYDGSSDSFTCDWSFNERRVVSGGYNNAVRIVDRNLIKNRVYKLPNPYAVVGHVTSVDGNPPPFRLRPRKLCDVIPTTLPQCQESVMKYVRVSTCHPKENLVALTSGPYMYLFDTTTGETK